MAPPATAGSPSRRSPNNRSPSQLRRRRGRNGSGRASPLSGPSGSRLLPADSEHNALFQALGSGNREELVRVIITASGGPFRTWAPADIEQATLEQALKHPNWSMGQKITIDSASMMNKALELIEAHWLFGLPARRLDAVVHPQSIVHSFVEFVDGSVFAQLSPPDMRMPIQYAITEPDRLPGCSPRIDWSTFGDLRFEPVDHERFPSLRTALEVIETGGSAGAVFNAANEVAVEAFLSGRIGFGGIIELVRGTLEASDHRSVGSLEEVLEADAAARALATSRLDSVEAGS